MAISDTNAIKGFFLNWDIENFNFCWHKTGEGLESSLFTINSSCKTSWRLWLYPRGEDDGEYISFYLFRAEGGPEVVDVDFELYLFVDDILVKNNVTFSKIYSFKCSQREGLKCFASRWEVFSPIAAKKDRFTLTAGCRVLKIDKNTLNLMHHEIRTVISTESISGIEVFDYDPSLESTITKDIEVKPLLEDEPLLNINLSGFKNRLVIKIHPKSCEKIRYTICKISVTEHWLNESPKQHVRTCIGQIKTDVWKYYVSQTDSVAPDAEPSLHRSFLLHYNFEFSTGNFVTDIQKLKFSFQEYLDVNLNDSKSSMSALNALKEVYRSHSFSDMNIQKKNETIPVHKAILSARSSKLMESISKETPNFPFDIPNEHIAKSFLSFMYSDTFEDPIWYVGLYLYKLAAACRIELLKAKCTTYLKNNLCIYSAIMILKAALYFDDLHLKNFVINYIINHADVIFPTCEWKQFSELKSECSMKIMLLKYKRPN